MKVSRMYAPTLRESPAEAEIASHRLMLRAGLMRKLVSGVYSYLPLGYRVIRKIEQIVREEMDRQGGLEIPCLRCSRQSFGERVADGKIMALRCSNSTTATGGSSA